VLVAEAVPQFALQAADRLIPYPIRHPADLVRLAC